MSLQVLKREPLAERRNQAPDLFWAVLLGCAAFMIGYMCRSDYDARLHKLEANDQWNDTAIIGLQQDIEHLRK